MQHTNADVLCICHIPYLVLSIVFHFILLSPPVPACIAKNVVKMQIQKAMCVFPADAEHNFTFAFSTILFGHHHMRRAHVIFILENRTQQSVFKKSTHKHVKFNLHVSDFYCSSKCNYWQFICVSFSIAVCCSWS